MDMIERMAQVEVEEVFNEETHPPRHCDEPLDCLGCGLCRSE